MFEKAAMGVPLNILRAKLNYSKNKSRSNKAMLLETKAVSPIRLKYGFFGYFGKDFFGELVRALISRIFDVILTFDY